MKAEHTKRKLFIKPNKELIAKAVRGDKKSLMKLIEQVYIEGFEDGRYDAVIEAIFEPNGGSSGYGFSDWNSKE